MKKIRNSMTLTKKVGIIKINTNENNMIETKKIGKNLIEFRIGINTMCTIDEIIKLIWKRNINKIIIENMNALLKEEKDKEYIKNRLTEANIKFFDIRTGYSNYNHNFFKAM